MKDTPEKPLSTAQKTPALKEGLFQGFRNKIAEKRTKIDKAKSTLRDTEKKKEQAQLSADLDKSNPGVFPNPPETGAPTETKTETTPDESEKLREEVGKEIGEEIKTKIDSIKESKSLEVLNKDEKTEIQVQILEQSIFIADLSDSNRAEAQKNIIDGLPGNTPEAKEKAWKEFSIKKQEELMLNSPIIRDKVYTLLTKYEEALSRPENLKDGKIKPEVLNKLAQDNLGSQTMSESMRDALTLDVLQNSADKKLREESSMEIASRVISEKGLQEITDTIGVENLKWSHIPPTVRLQMVGSDKFNYDKKALFEKNPQFAESLGQAIEGIKQKPGESAPDYKKRMETEYGLDDKAVAEGVQQMVSGGAGVSNSPETGSNISPFMQFIWSIFATIGALLPGPEGDMCRNYLLKSAGAAASYAESGSSGTGRHDSQSGEGIPESTGAPGEVTGDLARDGFKGNIMDSVWKWEYQAGKKAEVVPAGSSGLTLCGGIDLSWTKFEDVQKIFAGVLSPQTIDQLRPFCQNGDKQGIIRGAAQNLYNSKPALKEALDRELGDEAKMGIAFTNDLAIHWSNLVKKHGNTVKDAPGYIQSIMLSRFYHDGAGGSNSFITGLKSKGFTQAAVLSQLQSQKGRNGSSYYQNRINKEIAYANKTPPDSKPVNNPAIPQDSTGETGTDKNNTQTSGGISVGDSITTAMQGGEDDSVAKSTDGYGKYYKIGANSSDILGYVENAIAARPSSISILAGTNDITSGGNPLGNIQAMIEKCRAANIPVYVGTLPAIRGKEGTVSQVNAGIRGLAGEGVHIIDYARLGIQTTDGVHPSTGGYKRMKSLASSVIQNKVPANQSSTESRSQNSNTTSSIESTSTAPTNSAVNWFRENNGKPYGGGEGKYDCMTSTHAALGLDYTHQYGASFNGKYIDQKDRDHNLWNVSMAAAIYSGHINNANSRAPDGVIKKQKNGFYGEEYDDTSSMEYYIEENVMKRVSDSSNGIIDVGGNGKLLHYSKRNGSRAIYDDILRNNRLSNGQAAMMGATGEGTNVGGHEWLLSREGDKLMVYESTNYQNKGVSGRGVDLAEYLDDNRRNKYSQEAIIFAKK